MFENRTEKMTDGEREELKGEILKATPVSPPTKIKKHAPSARAIATLKAIEQGKTDFGADRKAYLREIAEAILGEKLTPNDFHTALPRLKLDNFKKFRAVVPESNTTTHNYPLGRVTIIAQEYNDYCMRMDGTIGNHLPPEDCRFAMLEEIDEFLLGLQNNAQAVTVMSTLGVKS